MNIKIAILLFIIYILLNSEIFITRILSSVDGTVTGLKTTTTKGTVIIGIILVLTYMLMDLLSEEDIL